jgi:glycine/D-amino acid oxidase-like deaminating enzyme
VERDQSLSAVGGSSGCPADCPVGGAGGSVVEGDGAAGLVAGADVGRGPRVSRRDFMSAALIGLTQKRGRTIAGGFVHEAHERGHLLRDGAPVPSPRESRRVPIVIVGGGIAGLSAAWQLRRRGMRDFVVLEMDEVAGGNARFGENEICAYPWAAHYVPVPAPGARGEAVRTLFTDLGVFDGQEWDERHLVHAPRERLFIHGRWEDGIEPTVGPASRDRDQIARFDDRMRELGAGGHFTVPSAIGRARGVVPVGDNLSMAAWMAREGFDSPWLKWIVDYACRDDYGALSTDVSAWAGVHYFASRGDHDDGPLTWPEGNGWVVRRLLARLGDRVRTGAMVRYVVRGDRAAWRVLTAETAWEAEAVILAAPWLVASRIVDGLPPADVVYSPWLTANLTLDRWPRERGLGPAWDNVIFDSPGLGYVVATHQQLRQHVPRTVWTYYWALAHDTPAAGRQWLLSQSWATLRDLVLKDLSRAHPDLPDCVTRVDIYRIGHAMVRPVPGFLSSPLRRAGGQVLERLYLAHSDVAGLPLFEEAHTAGVAAADAAVATLTRGR